jgi:hypothetical protein
MELDKEKNMIRFSKSSGGYVLILAALMALLLGGCTSETEKTPQQDTAVEEDDGFDSPRDADNDIIRTMITDFSSWAIERDPDKFKDAVTESFDAAAFIDTLWAGVDAQRVEFTVRRLRLSESEARAVLNAVFTRDGTVVKGSFVVIEFRNVEGKWKAKSFQLFGPNSQG